jgi:polysaccharide export outer membrane protein
MTDARPHRGQSRPVKGAIGILIAGFLLSACALPAAAPTSQELLNTQTDTSIPFLLVKMNSQKVLAIAHERMTFGRQFKAGYRPKNQIRSGDVLAVTIYETGGSSLFPAPDARVASASLTTGSSGNLPTAGGVANTIPPQIVESDGTINVPFAGRVQVASLTPSEVGQRIEVLLKQKAVAPQVVVTFTASNAHAATVGGEVNAAKMVPLGLRGERLLDVIAAAGGPKHPAYESYVHVMRGSTSGQALLQSVITNVADNIVVQPGDQIYVSRNPRTYVVMGATQRPATFTFDREKVTLVEAVAQAGGPIDSIGDPSGVYVFRFEPYQLAERLAGGDVSAYAVDGSKGFIPVLYQVNMRDADGYFLAQSFQVRDKDVVLITNAGGAQLLKVLQVIRGFTGIAYDLKRGYSY